MTKSILHVHGQKRPLHKTKAVISSLYLVGVKSAVLIPLRCSVRAFTKPFGVLSQKQTTVCNVMFTNWYHSGQKYCKPRPQNRVFVPLTVFFSHFPTGSPVFFILTHDTYPSLFAHTISTQAGSQATAHLSISCIVPGEKKPTNQSAWNNHGEWIFKAAFWLRKLKKIHDWVCIWVRSMV